MNRARPPARPWTSGEENQLCEMLEAGSTAEEIAAKLDRTRHAIYARIQRIYRQKPLRDVRRR
jgi:DNA-binding CsgD family transcriptional regulator